MNLQKNHDATAKKAGRTNFGVMVGKFQQMKKRYDEPPKMILLCEKTDRLYRNIRDWVIMDDLDVEIHFVKENQILSKESKSSEKFVHGIKVLMAKSYVDNLSEETRKGMLEKAEQGLFPMKAPLGYCNVRRDGKSVIEPSNVAPYVTQMFQLYASGAYSLNTLQQKMINDYGLKGRDGADLTTSTVHNVLRNPLFYGVFRFKGHLYLGKHEPLITKEIFDLCQEMMAKRFQGMKKKRKHEFVYQGLITCGDCGCILTAEKKKEKYIYYHCSNGRKVCKKIYFAEHKLDKQFDQILPSIDLPEELYDQTVKALKDANSHIHDHQLQRRKELDAEYLDLKGKMKILYDDRLEKRISLRHYEDSRAQFKLEMGLIHKKMELLEKASFNCLEDGLKILELAKNANIAYKMGNIESRKQLLRILLSNCKMEGRKLTVKWRQPFDSLALMCQEWEKERAVSNGGNSPCPKKLPGLDSNQ